MERLSLASRHVTGAPVRSSVQIRTDERILSAVTADQATCAFPDCDRPVTPPPPTGGRSSYCSRPDHNRTTAFVVRKAEAAGRAPPPPGTLPAAPSGAGTPRRCAVRSGDPDRGRGPARPAADRDRGPGRPRTGGADPGRRRGAAG